MKFQGVRTKTGGGKRGVIEKLSSGSAKRCTTVFRALAHKFTTEACLTYPAEYLGLLDGPTSKKHLRALIQWLEETEIGEKLVYAWVLEFQKNGNPHYHLLLSHWVAPQALAERWFRIVGSGLEKHRYAGTSINPIRDQTACLTYMSRYIAKMDQKEVPAGFKRVGRFWGYRRGSVEKVEMTLGYPDRESAKRDTRPLRRARRAKLREFGHKWKWKQGGFTDRTLGLDLSSALLDSMQGEFVDRGCG